MPFNNLAKIIAALDSASGDLTAELAKAIVEQAKQNSPDDTGYMESTIYYVTSKESSYGQGVGTPPEDAHLLPEIPKPDNVTDAYVGAVGASYGIYPEMGTVHRRSTALPHAGTRHCSGRYRKPRKEV